MEVKTQNQISHDSWYKERGHSREVERVKGIEPC